MRIALPVRMGENNSEIVDANGALVAYVHGTALLSMEAAAREIIASLNERITGSRTRKIVASPTHSPLPVRQHDWCAHYEGEEEAGNYGYGATKEAAIEDFVLNCAASHDERLDDPRGTYPFKRWWPDVTETVGGK